MPGAPLKSAAISVGAYRNWELEAQEILPHLVGPGMKVLDIGANIGFFVLALSRLVGPKGSCRVRGLTLL